MRNIKMTIQYDGSRYKGWQKQNIKGTNVSTIQDKIEKVLSKMTGEEIQVIGCGRTDTGVHADKYIANFKTNSEKKLSDISKYLHEFLPEDISVTSLSEASDRFHSRLNVISKTYVYTIDNNKFANVFLKKYAYHVEGQLNIEKMKEASQYLIGTHDFKGFSGVKDKAKKSTIRTINYINITNNIIDSNSKLINTTSIGYKYYIPKGVTLIKDNDFNQKLKVNNTYMYLYTDIVSYYYRNDDNYQNNEENLYYYKPIENGQKKGFLKIKKENDQFLLEIVYNYAKIELYSSKYYLNQNIAYASIILDSIKYNDTAIKTLINKNYFSSYEQKYALDKPKTSESNFLEYSEEYNTYEEKNELPDDKAISNKH